MEAKQTTTNKTARQILVYLGSAWLLVEVSNFIIDRYNFDPVLIDIIILFVLFGLPATVIHSLFIGRFNVKAVALQALNVIGALAVVFYFLTHPLSMNPGQLRVLKLDGGKVSELSSLKAVAVLPFSNYLGDESQAYLLAGMHDGLIAEMGKLTNFRTISKTSTLRYENTGKSLMEIADDLGVDAIVETSLTKIDSLVEIRIKLISAYPEEIILWDHAYSVYENELPNLYREVTRNVAGKIGDALVAESELQLAPQRVPNPGAYQAFLRGSYYTGFLTLEGFDLAEQQFKRAIELDSLFAPAYSGLHLILASQRQMGYIAGEKSVRLLDSLAYGAYRLDSTDASILLMMASHHTWTEFDWENAEVKFKESINRNPNDAPARSAYAHYLMIQNRWEEAWVQMNVALELDPENPWVLAFSMPMYGNDGKILSAAKSAERLLQIAPNHPMADMILLHKYVALKNDEVAVTQLIEVLNNYGVGGAKSAVLEGFKDGEFESAMRALMPFLENYAMTNSISSFQMFVFYGLINDHEMQDKWILKMYEESHPGLPYLGIKKIGYESDVRTTVMKEIGLW
ncbi:MAG: hypothetical protein JXQ90_19135 [Cyclobacteriaceae bacterium]